MASSDAEQLHQLGYAQELRRGMKTFSNFAVSFTIISILSGLSDAVRVRDEHRRPGRHDARLAGRRLLRDARGARAWPRSPRAIRRPAACTTGPPSSRPSRAATGASGAGSSAGSTSSARSRSRPASTSAWRRSPTAFLNLMFGYPDRRRRSLIRSTASCWSSTRCSTRSGSGSSRCSTTCPCGGTSSASPSIVIVARRPQPAHPDRHRHGLHDVRRTAPGDSDSGWPGPMILGIPLYVALIGLLNAQYTLTGYDASAHMSEETHDAARRRRAASSSRWSCRSSSGSSSSWR